MLVNPSYGEICAVLSSDNNYYRGRIEELNDDNTVKAFYIDYGNCEVVPNSNIKGLVPKFKNMSALAVKVFLPMKNIQNKEETVINEIKSITGGFVLQFKVLNVYQSNWIGNIEANGFSIIDILRQKDVVKEARLDEIKTIIDAAAEQEKKVKLKQMQKNRERFHASKQPDSNDGVQKQQISSQQVQSQQVQPQPSQPQQIQPQPAQPHQVQPQPAQPQQVQPQPAQPQQVQPQQIQPQQQPQLQKNQQEMVPPEQPAASSAPEKLSAIDKASNRTKAYISHADRPDSFYLQLESSNDELTGLQQSLQLIGSSIPPLTDFRTGASCIAKYSVDDQWYRAKIIDTDGHITSIRFTDYGNTDTITENNLLKCGGQFEKIREMAIHCSLPIQPRNSREWSDEACKKILHINNEQALEYECICESNQNKMYVNLFTEGRDITKELIIEGYADPLEIIKSGEKCYVSHVNSLNDFYVQMDRDSQALQLIEDYFLDVSKFGQVTECRKGSICIAQYEDEKYYRARILDDSMTSDGLKVFFIDYGNTFMAKNIRALPENIAELQQLLKKCSMKLPSGVKEWSEQAEKKFTEIALSENIFTVQLSQPGRKATVELFMDDRNIGDELAELCEKGAPTSSIIDEHEISHAIQTPQPVSLLSNVSAREPAYISHVNSMDDFYIQLAAKAEGLEVMVVNLQAAYDLPEISMDQIKEGDICAAKFVNDGFYYRAKVLEKVLEGCKVLFIDYGNESFSSDLRTLPSVLTNAEPLAIHCKLSANTTAWTADDQKNFKEIGDPNETFQIEIIDCGKMPCVINLYNNDQNVRDLVLKKNSNANVHASNEKNDKQTEDSENNNNINAKTSDAVVTDTVTKSSEANNVASELVSNIIQTAIQSQ